MLCAGASCVVIRCGHQDRNCGWPVLNARRWHMWCRPGNHCSNRWAQQLPPCGRTLRASVWHAIPMCCTAAGLQLPPGPRPPPAGCRTHPPGGCVLTRRAGAVLARRAADLKGKEYEKDHQSWEHQRSAGGCRAHRPLSPWPSPAVTSKTVGAAGLVGHQLPRGRLVFL